MRPSLIRAATLVLSLLAVSTLSAQRPTNSTLDFPSDLPTGEYEIRLVRELSTILAIASPPSSTDSVFLAERAGRIQRVLDIDTGTLADTPFLDISSRVTTNLENGLLGLAFHPQYERNGYFYVFYTTNASGTATTRLSRFTRSSQDPSSADPTSELILFDQVDQAPNHNGGALAFGLDGYLFVTVGDEGGGGDNFGNGQRIDRDLFAGLLRIDVDKLPDNIEPTAHPAIPRDSQGLAPFSIPLDNPLVPHWQAEGADPDSNHRLEFYAIGFRNPWQMDIDPLTGDIWISDVGEDAYEEINLVHKGGNYGWPNREGAHNFEENRAVPPEFGPLIDPIFEYGRSLGVSISGGLVYRGSALPELYGAYLFSDIFSNRAWVTRWSDENARYETSAFSDLHGVSAWGRDPRNGEILVGNHWGDFGTIIRSESSSQANFPTLLSETGAFSDLEALTPEEGILPYAPKISFWSDHAIKSRWVSVPGQAQVGYSQDDPWEIPTGTVFVKHFEIETEAGNPSSRRRIETRFLVKTDDSAYGLSYQWDESGDDATLVPPEGTSIDISLTRDGESMTQQWDIPSRSQCLSCHTPAAGFALSFNTRQLNRIGDHDGQAENTLSYFSRLGLLDTELTDTSNIPIHYTDQDEGATLEQRARSYIAVNCVSCHQPNGGTPTTWDARPHITLEATGLIDGIVGNNGGDPDKRLVVAQMPENSILLDRMAARDGFRRMPPIASNLLDQQGIELITNWIAQHGVESQFELWQTEHFSSALAPEAAPNADPDFDGNSNRLEFLNGTLPNDPQSVWRPVFSLDQDSLSVSFPMAPGRAFVIEKSTDLSTWTEWQVSGNPPSSNEQQAEIDGTLSGADKNAFFRVTVDEQAPSN